MKKLITITLGSAIVFSLAAFAIDYHSAPALDQRYYFEKEKNPEKRPYDEQMKHEPVREPASVIEEKKEKKWEYKHPEYESVPFTH